MKIKKIVLITSIILSSSVYSQESPNNINNEDINKILENNKKVNKESFYLNYYKSRGANGRISTKEGFVLDKPLSMRDVSELNHPYYQKKLEYVKEFGLDAIGEELNKEEFGNLRVDAIYNEALKMGIQSALFDVLYDFNNSLSEMESSLKSLFDFGNLMLAEGRVKPPVILETSAIISKDNKYQLRSSDASYLIYSQAEVTLRAPSYLDYLTFGIIKPKEPETLLLPTTDEELKVWKEGVNNGWILGIKQGNDIIKEGFSSLIRDYLGMEIFHIMHKANIVSMPSFERMEIGTTTDGRNLRVGEVTFKVSILPEFNGNTDMWKALPRLNEIYTELERIKNI
jgi:defect-in-organelle-trafficking protein DotC